MLAMGAGREGKGRGEAGHTVILHDVPIAHALPILPPKFHNRPNHSPGYNPQPRTDGPPLCDGDVRELGAVRARGDEDVPAGDGGVVEEGEEVGGGEEEVR